MKSKLWLFLGLLALFGLSAKADWLYWTLDFTGGDAPWQVSDPQQSAPSAAWLVARSSEGGDAISYSSLFEGGASTVGVDLSDFWSKIEVAFRTDIGGNPGSAYNFYIELGNTLGEATWVSDGISYNDAQNFGHITASAMQSVGLTAWTPENWTESAVPEPTSGLLVLMGMGLLALRRRRTDVRG